MQILKKKNLKFLFLGIGIILLIIIIFVQSFFVTDVNKIFKISDDSKAATITSSPMTLISRNLKTYSLNNSSGHTPDLVNDNNYYADHTWQPSSTPSWISFDLSTLPVAQRTKIAFGWWTPYAQMYNRFGDQTGIPYDYTIDINTAPSNASSPTTGWTTIKTITNSKFGMLMHNLDINGANWIRMNITSVRPGSNEMPQLNIDMYDISQGNTESWLLIGDSITSMSTTPSGSVQPGSDNIATLINNSYPNNYPSFSDGGMSGSSLGEALSMYLDEVLANYDVRYVSLNFGTNNGITFADLDTAVQKIIASGKIPVIPQTMMWSEDTAIQAAFPNYDSITKQIFTKYPQIIKGPDLWNIFKNHTEWMADVLHPNYIGQQIYRKSWADAIKTNVYSSQISLTSTPIPTSTTKPIPSPTSTTTPVTNGTWKEISPPGVSKNIGNVVNSNCIQHTADNYGYSSLVMDPINPSIIYTGTNYQGLYKSLNGGSTWTKINTGTNGCLLDSGRLWSMAISPFTNSLGNHDIYTTAGYGEGGVLKSSDGGINWQQMYTGLNLKNTSGTADTVKTTKDIYGISIDPFTPNHLIASFHYYWNDNQDSGIIESKDGGSTWITHHSPNNSGWGAGVAVWFGNDSNTWITGNQNCTNCGIWKRSVANNVESWSKVFNQNITHGGINSMYRNPNNGNLFLALSTQIIKSTDNGSSWTDLSSSGNYWESIIGDGTNLYTMAAFPTDTMGNQNWYTHPENGGSWTVFNSPQLTMGPFQMAYDSINHIIYSANGDGGVFKLQTSSTTTLTSTPVANCICNTNNLCSNSCTFTNTSNAGLSCSSEIGTPTPNDKNNYCTREFRTKGDADGDGLINSLDYIYYVRAVNGGTIPAYINPDFNGDGKISVSDRTVVIQNIQR